MSLYDEAKAGTIRGLKPVSEVYRDWILGNTPDYQYKGYAPCYRQRYEEEQAVEDDLYNPEFNEERTGDYETPDRIVELLAEISDKLSVLIDRG